MQHSAKDDAIRIRGPAALGCGHALLVIGREADRAESNQETNHHSRDTNHPAENPPIFGNFGGSCVVERVAHGTDGAILPRRIERLAKKAWLFQLIKQFDKHTHFMRRGELLGAPLICKLKLNR